MYDDMNGATKCTCQSPGKIDIYYSTYVHRQTKQLYAKIFLEDMCNSYSITLRKDFSDREFFEFKGEEVKFNQLFGYDFLRWDIDKLLSNITENLILFGEAYVERIFWYDDDHKLIKVTYICINCKKIKKHMKCVCYKAKDSEGHIQKGKIQTKNVMSFKLSDIGFSKRFFIRKMRKMKKLELPDAKLSLNKNFSLDAFRDKKDLYLLKLMHDVYWSARSSDNQYVNEPYLIYRHMMFEKIQNSFLEYLVSKINNDILNIVGINGQIVFESITQNYDALLKEFDDGTKNCQDIGNVIYKVHK